MALDTPESANHHFIKSNGNLALHLAFPGIECLEQRLPGSGTGLIPGLLSYYLHMLVLLHREDDSALKEAVVHFGQLWHWSFG